MTNQLTRVAINQLVRRLPKKTEDENGRVTIPTVSDTELQNAVELWRAETHWFTGNINLTALRIQLVRDEWIA